MKPPRPVASCVTGLLRSTKGQVRQFNYVPESKKKFVAIDYEYPSGFLIGYHNAGIKPSSHCVSDVTTILSSKPCSAAAVFTTNKFQAAPVRVSKEVLEHTKGYGIRGVVANSGCANAVTGDKGYEDAKAMVAMVDTLAGGDKNDPRTLVMSTGVIGQRLPMEKVLDGIKKCGPRPYSGVKEWLHAADAISTTDTFPKARCLEFTLPSSPDTTYRLGGITKGAGMIHPNMATLLGIICTDAPLEPSALQELLKYAVNRSFNCISVDGDTSTNDTVAILANGNAGGNPITSAESPDYLAMRDALTEFTQSLSQLVVRDGEGATKFVTVRVQNSQSYDEGRLIASTIATSPLVKTALYGKDANWGRILCAIGYAPGISPETVVPEKTSVTFRPPVGKGEDLKVLVNGEPVAFNEERASELLKEEDVEIVVDLGGGAAGESGKGGEEAVYWFCDFSHEYVTINGDYRT